MKEITVKILNKPERKYRLFCRDHVYPSYDYPVVEREGESIKLDKKIIVGSNIFIESKISSIIDRFPSLLWIINDSFNLGITKLKKERNFSCLLIPRVYWKDGLDRRWTIQEEIGDKLKIKSRLDFNSFYGIYTSTSRLLLDFINLDKIYKNIKIDITDAKNKYGSLDDSIYVLRDTKDPTRTLSINNEEDMVSSIYNNLLCPTENKIDMFQLQVRVVKEEGRYTILLKFPENWLLGIFSEIFEKSRRKPVWRYKQGSGYENNLESLSKIIYKYLYLKNCLDVPMLDLFTEKLVNKIYSQ